MRAVIADRGAVEDLQQSWGGNSPVQACDLDFLDEYGANLVLLDAGFPDDAGGSLGQDAHATANVGDAHLLACVVPIWKHGSPEQKAKYLPGLCCGERIAVNGMTETSSDAFAMSTRAVPDGEGFRITGNKTFSSNGPVADLAVVYAVTDPEKGAQGGITGFIIEKDTPGFVASQKFEKMGLRTALMGELVLEDVYVAKEAVLGGVGGGMMVFSESTEWERVCIGATHVGNMRHLLEKAIDYAKTHTAYGQSIGKFQAISHKIADMKINLEAGRLLTYRAASRLSKARDNAMDASMDWIRTSTSSSGWVSRTVLKFRMLTSCPRFCNDCSKVLNPTGKYS